MYQLTDVQQMYGARTVLNVGALTVKTGELLAVIGPSGAGKSTLLRLLHFLEQPARGAINFRGAALQYPVAVDVRREVGMVFQRPEMVRGSVWENVSLGLKFRKIDDLARVDVAIKQVGLSSLKEQSVVALSGGELQRVALARVLVLRPRVLLLDEPTANLDPANVNLVESIIRGYHQRSGAAVVFVTHNIFQARRLADRVAFLLNGELVETGACADFFDDPKDPRSRAFVRGEMIY